MSETPYNADDPAFLASRSLDGELSASERQRLNRALGASKSLRAEHEGLRAVDQLVKSWGSGEVDLDWAAYGKLVQAKALAEPDVERDRKLDGLLASWADERAAIDDEAFTAAVMASVEVRSRRAWRRSLVFRLGAPLAAAAAVALMVTGTLVDWSSPAPRVEVVIGPRATTVRSIPEPMRVAVVSFRREPGADFAPEPTASGISFMFVGASPLPEDWSNEAPPL